MNNRGQIFLETSIQVERLIHLERKPAIMYNLLGKQLHTSCYVFAEFRRTFLVDFRFLYSVVKDQWDGSGEREMRLSDLLDALSRVRAVRSERRFRRFFWIVSDLLRCFGDDPVPVSDVLEWLDEQSDAFTEEFFLVDSSGFNGKVETLEYHCSSNCDLARDDRDLSRMRCRREEARCPLPQFLLAHKEHLRAILSAFENAPSNKRDNRAMGVLQQLLASNDFEKVKGQHNCWRLGDIIVALEAPENVPIYTLDDHFDAICKALGKERYEEQTPPSA